VSKALLAILNGISEEFGKASNGNLVVNPVNPKEVLSENWIGNIKARENFGAFVRDTTAQLSEALLTAREDRRTVLVRDLFGVRNSASI
jgi:hypothetical protein